MATKNMQRPEILAQLFGISVRRVQQLTQEGILQSEKVEGALGRQYDLIPNIKAYISYLQEKVSGRIKNDKELDLKNKKLEAEIALKESQGELHRLKTDIQAGRYIAVEDVQLDYERFFLIFKKFVMAIPTRVGVQLNGYVDPVTVRAIEKDIGKETTSMLNAFICAAIQESKDKEPKLEDLT